MKEFFEKLETLTSAFDHPEYLFLVLEPLQTWGIAFGLIGLVVGVPATWFFGARFRALMDEADG